MRDNREWEREQIGQTGVYKKAEKQVTALQEKQVELQTFEKQNLVYSEKGLSSTIEKQHKALQKQLEKQRVKTKDQLELLIKEPKKQTTFDLGELGLGTLGTGMRLSEELEVLKKDFPHMEKDVVMGMFLEADTRAFTQAQKTEAKILTAMAIEKDIPTKNAEKFFDDLTQNNKDLFVESINYLIDMQNATTSPAKYVRDSHFAAKMRGFTGVLQSTGRTLNFEILTLYVVQANDAFFLANGLKLREIVWHFSPSELNGSPELARLVTQKFPNRLSPCDPITGKFYVDKATYQDAQVHHILQKHDGGQAKLSNSIVVANYHHWLLHGMNEVFRLAEKGKAGTHANLSNYAQLKLAS